MSQPKSSHPPLLVSRDGNAIDDIWTYVEDEAPITDISILSFERALNDLGDLNGHYGVRLNPADDVRRLLPYLDKISLIEVAFPGFRDGRGFSTARILREDMGYQGPLRAIGDILRDLLGPMLRCGFDEFYLKDDQPQEALAAANTRFAYVYQNAADNLTPAFHLRHPS
jgi:uncharacterized protein (DUF934 family)